MPHPEVVPPPPLLVPPAERHQSTHDVGVPGHPDRGRKLFIQGRRSERRVQPVTHLEEQATHDLDALPEDIIEMLNVLPGDARAEVEREWEENQRAALMAEVRAIILDALQTKGEVAA